MDKDQKEFYDKHKARINSKNNSFNTENWWLQREDEPDIQEYKERARSDGEGSLRIGEAMTFREDMYNLCFVAQVKLMYKEACEAEDQELETKMQLVRTKVYGEEPATVEDVEEEWPPEEDEEQV